jgi:hypothetical protein
MANPAWARAAVRDLSPRARAALRILVRVPREVSARELDALVQAMPSGEAGGTSPVAQLVSRGLATISLEHRAARADDRRLSAVDALRGRLGVLLQEEVEAGPPLPRDDAEAFAIQRFDLQIGVLIAVLEQTRPRVTRLLDLHRTDERAVVEQLSALFGSTEEAARRLDQLVRSGLFQPYDGRLALDWAEMARWESPLSVLLRMRLEERRNSTIFRVLVGQLLAQPGWVRETALAECGAVAALSSAPFGDSLRRLREELSHVARLPGVELQRDPSHAWWRLRTGARQALEGGAASAPRGRFLLVQPNLQIVASPGAPAELLARLGRVARLVSADQVAVFALDDATIHRAASEGMTAQEMLGLLEGSASQGVPSTVARALMDWARTAGRARVTTGAVLQTEVALDEVRRILGPRYPVVQLAPGWLKLEAAQYLAALPALRKAGIVCEPFEADRPVEDAGPREADDPDDDLEDDVGMSAPANQRSSLSKLGNAFRQEALQVMKLPSA